VTIFCFIYINYICAYSCRKFVCIRGKKMMADIISVFSQKSSNCNGI